MNDASSPHTIMVRNAEADHLTSAEIIVQNNINYTPKVSVIIPVYNSADYLQECLDSVINQTLKEIEIICIDDGSTDNSLEILKAYAARDNRICVIKQENSGVSAARNRGIILSKGKYISFIDSDDWIDLDFYSELYVQAENTSADITKADMIREYADKAVKSVLNSAIKDNKYNFSGEFYSAIYNRDFLVNKNIFFPDNILTGEDITFSINAILNCKILQINEKTNYHYRIRAFSKGKTLTEAKSISLIDNIVLIIKMLNNSNISSEDYERIVYKFAYRQVLGRCKAAEKSFEETTTLLGILKEKMQPLLKYYVKDVSDANLKELYCKYFKIPFTNNKQDNNITSLSDKELENIDSVLRKKILISSLKDRPYFAYLSSNQKNVEQYNNRTRKPDFVFVHGNGSWTPQPQTIKYAIENDIPLIKVEDGFLRSADTWCNRNVDKKYTSGISFQFTNDAFYFDATTSSYIERQINNPDFKLTEKELLRVKKVIKFIIDNNLTKYNHQPIYTPKIGREGAPKILVVDQSYGDFSIKQGLADDNTFTRMLDAAIEENLNADIIIKTHPDAIAPGTNRPLGYYSTLEEHDNIYILREPVNPISLLKCVDKVYVCTTQLGFEALLCGKEVHTFGMPFYAGWGLTIDRLTCPRRTAKRTLEEIFYVVYIKNAYYVDPIRKCRCSIEEAMQYLIDLREDFKKYKESPKISVIIPVYNAESYLKECLDSVIYQTMKEIEIICVDDGSSDASPQILKEYAQRDKRITVITQENLKLGTARNNAMKIASGEYVLFLDSDDWIREDTCEILYNTAKEKNAYMINFEGINHYADGHKEQLPAQTIYYTNKSVLGKSEILSLINKLPISACRYFYKRSFLTSNKINFPERLLFEDNIYVLKSLILTENLCTCRDILYQRRVHKESITQNWDKNFSDYLNMTVLLEKELSNLSVDTNIKDSLIKKYCNQIFNRYKRFSFCYRKKHYKQTQKILEYLLKDHYTGINKFYEEELSNWYKRRCGERLYVDDPRTYNEKIQWLKLYDSTPQKTKLADKYLVRDWVREKIGEQYLIPLLGVYDRFEDIDFDGLPNRFVIKCNHGCGYNIIVKDKQNIDYANVSEKLDKWMNENFALKSGLELQYRDIEHKIIIEKYIENKASGGDLYDYKFWCFGGKVEYIQFLSERNTDGLKMAFYDREWRKQDFVYSHPLDSKEINKPDNLQKMINLAEKLSEGFNHVRVDFYRLDDGTIYFGEMTFTSASGACKWNNNEVNRYFGHLIQLPKFAYNTDTGTYYKRPKPSLRNKVHKLSLCKPYLFFPYYGIQLLLKRRKYAKKLSKQVVKKLTTMRIDIKNVGSAQNAVSIKTKGGIITQPAWFSNAQGIGHIVETYEPTQEINIKAIKRGKLVLRFRGPDKQYKKERFPLWIDIKSIRIDGKEILATPISVWYDKPFCYEMPVKDGQNVSVKIEQSYHPYSMAELSETVKKLHLGTNYEQPEVIGRVYQRISRKSIGHYLFHKEKNERCKKYYFCGVRIWKKKVSIYNYIDLRLNTIENKLKKELNAQISRIEKSFNISQGKSVDLLRNSLQQHSDDLLSEQNKKVNMVLDALYLHSDKLLSLQNEGYAMLKDDLRQHHDDLAAIQNEAEASLKGLLQQYHDNLTSEQTENVASLKDTVQQHHVDMGKSIDLLQVKMEEYHNAAYPRLNQLLSTTTANYRELNYADLLHDSIAQSFWLKDRTFSLFGWAANYSFIYTLYRFLDNLNPQHILEMGLGQTTKLTTQYIAYKNPTAILDICEHNQAWIDIYKPSLPESSNIHIRHFELEYFEHEGKTNDKYAGLIEYVGKQKYDFIIVDGPVGGGKNFPRSNVLDLIQNDNLDENFVIIFDDSSRAGEKAVIHCAEELLLQKGIEYTSFKRNGIKHQCVLTSKSWEYAQFL